MSEPNHGPDVIPDDPNALAAEGGSDDPNACAHELEDDHHGDQGGQAAGEGVGRG
jgi:hypothetical protein